MGGRGVLALLVIAAGVWLLYGVITGRTLGVAPTASGDTSSNPPPAGVTQTGTKTGGGLIDNGSGQYLPGGRIGPGQKGSGPDVTASNGGMTDFTNGIRIAPPGSLPTMTNLYGASRGMFV